MGTLRDEDDDQESTEQHVEVEQEQPEAEDTNVIEAGGEQDQEDQRIAAEQDDDAGSEEEEDGEQHTRRRETARQRRERARRAKQQDKEELQILRATTAKQDQRLNQMERALIETRVADFENRLATAQSYVNQWNEVDIKATKAGNVQDAVTARQYREQAAKEAAQYAQHVQQLRSALQGSGQQQAPQPPPFAPMAMNFLKDKPWYNPKQGDEDSLIVEALDKALQKTMDPNDPRYWNELDRRVRKRLPHKFRQTSSQESDEDYDVADDDSQEEAPRTRQTSQRRGPPTGGSSRTTSTGGKVTEIRLPAQMVEAMKEAGQWDDPKKRASVAKRYLAGLKQNRG